MSYAGHVIDMINRIKQNRDLVKSRRERINRVKELYVSSPGYQRGQLQNRRIPKEIVDKVKADFRKKIKRERKMALLLTIGSMLVVISFLAFLASKITTI